MCNVYPMHVCVCVCFYTQIRSKFFFGWLVRNKRFPNFLIYQTKQKNVTATKLKCLVKISEFEWIMWIYFLLPQLHNKVVGWFLPICLPAWILNFVIEWVNFIGICVTVCILLLSSSHLHRRWLNKFYKKKNEWKKTINKYSCRARLLMQSNNRNDRADNYEMNEKLVRKRKKRGRRSTRITDAWLILFF